MLVVGDGMHAIERVGDINQPALAVDFGDRLLERHPTRDVLVDEQADHLALIGGLDLLRDDHLDPVRPRRRLVSASDDVVVGHGDRTQTAGLRGLEQHVDRRGAVRRVVGVHVQVDIDQRAVL